MFFFFFGGGGEGGSEKWKIFGYEDFVDIFRIWLYFGVISMYFKVQNGNIIGSWYI